MRSLGFGQWALLLGLLLLGACTASPPSATSTSLDVGDLTRQAAAAYERGEWTQAMALYRRLVAVQPDRAQWWIRYGWTLRNTRHYEAALRAFARADRLDPHAYWSAYGQALTYLALKRYDEALAAFQRAITIDPTRPGPHEWRSRIYLQLKSDDAAIDAALYGLNQVPDDHQLQKVLQEAEKQLRW